MQWTRIPVLGCQASTSCRNLGNYKLSKSFYHLTISVLIYKIYTEVLVQEN